MPKKLTARQKANRKNRAKWTGLTEAGRERLRQGAHDAQPWRTSTGPATAAGKARSRANALRHGGRALTLVPPEMRDLLVALAGSDGENSLPPPPVVEAAIASLVAKGHPAAIVRASQLVRRYTARVLAVTCLSQSTV